MRQRERKTNKDKTRDTRRQEPRAKTKTNTIISSAVIAPPVRSAGFWFARQGIKTKTGERPRGRQYKQYKEQGRDNDKKRLD